MKKTKFSIYIASFNGSAKDTCAKFEKACDEIFGDKKYEIEIIDIIKNSATAEKERILAIPTIVRQHPKPLRRIIGDLGDHENATKAVQYLISDLEL